MQSPGTRQVGLDSLFENNNPILHLPAGSQFTSVSVVLPEQKKQYLGEINFPPPQGRLIKTENIKSIILVLTDHVLFIL